jgi:hypothetical protein
MEPFSTGEIVWISIGGTAMIVVVLVGLVSAVRFYGEPATKDATYGKQNVPLETTINHHHQKHLLKKDFTTREHGLA